MTDKDSETKKVGGETRAILNTIGTSRDLNARQPHEHQLANYVRQTDAVKASAETNSLSRLLREGDRIVFPHSQTGEGKQCAEVLAQHYEDTKYNTCVIEVADLAYAESRFKMCGLRSLVARLIDQIRHEKAQEREMLINATSRQGKHYQPHRRDDGDARLYEHHGSVDFLSSGGCH